MTRIALIDGHPDPRRAHFVHALADAYAEGAQGRHEVRRIDIAELDFPVLRSPEQWREGPLPEGLAEAQQAMGWAEHLVVFYPLWLGDMPALLKAFFEQVGRPGFALEEGPGAGRKLLKGRSARIVVTMGMPALFYRLVYRAHSVKSLKRNILRFVGYSPVRTSVVGMVEGGAAKREKWLARMRAMGAAAR
jgi:putative NADPH-quinone reductase